MKSTQSSQNISLYFAFTPLHLKIINSIPKKEEGILVTLGSKSLLPYEKSYIKGDQFFKVYNFYGKYLNPFFLWKISTSYNIIDIYIGNFKFFNFRLVHLLVR